MVKPIVAKSKTINLQAEIDRAIISEGVVHLPAGRFETETLNIKGSVWLQGIPGHTVLVSLGGGPILSIADAQNVSISGTSFVGTNAKLTEEQAKSALVIARSCENLRIEDCIFSDSKNSGLSLDRCSGQISSCHFTELGQYGIFAWNSKGLVISNNDVSQIGNNGILVWRAELSEDGTQVLGNRVHNIRADAGGDGQNGNGINIFRAGNVITANNRVSDTAFSSIRYNSGSNAQILGNSLSRSGEVALFVEFSYEGAIVANNIIDDAQWGIEITNLDVGGRLGVCSGNLIRNIRGGPMADAGESAGIIAEGETLISNNVLENIITIGIRLGWGPYARNLLAQGNIIRNCERGIVVTTSEGAGQQMVTGNMISGAKLGGIQGMDYNTVTLTDMLKAPPHISISNNTITD